MLTVDVVLFLVVAATVVATVARKIRVPAPSLLVVVGVVAGSLPGVPPVHVTPEVVSLVVLPPLLYAAAEELPWRDLRAVWKPVSALAVGLVLASAAAVAAVAVAMHALPIGMALVLGTVLASTDPVAVTALGRRLALPPRVAALVQAESLFNDATSLLLFRVALAGAVVAGAAGAHSGLDWGHTLTEFGLLAGVGVAVGAVCAGGVWLIRRRTTDPVLDSVIALVTPYAAYLVAEQTHGSGVTAVVVAGVLLGTQTPRFTTARSRLQLSAVYPTVVFVLESVVFGLIGLELPTLLRDLGPGDQWWPLGALAITAALIGIRALWVFPLASVLRRRRGGGAAAGRSAWAPAGRTWWVAAVVSWAGARGVVPLAATLSIPIAAADGTPLPQRNLTLVLATAVIVITLVVQGFTLAPLVRRAGIAVDPAEAQREETVARLRLSEAALAYLEELADTEAASEVVVEQLRRQLLARMDRIRERPAPNDTPAATNTTEPAAPASSPEPSATAYRRARHDLLAVEAAELTRLFEAGTISDATRRRIQRTLDLDAAGLGDATP